MSRQCITKEYQKILMHISSIVLHSEQPTNKASLMVAFDSTAIIIQYHTTPLFIKRNKSEIILALIIKNLLL